MTKSDRCQYPLNNSIILCRII